MKQNKLTKLALLGISMGLWVSSCDRAKAQEMSSEMRTFYEQLNSEGQRKFMQLDAQHRQMAVEAVQNHCRAEHECKGIRERVVEEQLRHQKQQKNP